MSESETVDIDTREAMLALSDAVGGSYRARGKALKTSYANLCALQNGSGNPPTLDNLARLARRARHMGINLTFSYDPEDGFTYTIEKTNAVQPHETEGTPEPGDVRAQRGAGDQVDNPFGDP